MYCFGWNVAQRLCWHRTKWPLCKIKNKKKKRKQQITNEQVCAEPTYLYCFAKTLGPRSPQYRCMNRLAFCFVHLKHALFPPPPPPPPVYFLKYLKNALCCGLETFWQIKWTKFKNKIKFSTVSPTLGYHSKVIIDTYFWKHISAAFMQQVGKIRRFFFANFMKCPKWSLLWKFGLDVPLDGVLVTVFNLHSFLFLNYLKLGNPISMKTRMASFNLVC